MQVNKWNMCTRTNYIYFYHIPFNESGAQTVKIKSAKDKLSINFSGPLPLQSTLEVVTEKVSFLLSHKGNVFSLSLFLFCKRLSKMKGVRLCFFFLAWSRMYGWGMTDVCNQLQWSMLKFQSNPLISLQSRKPKQMGSALHYKNTAALLCCIM